MIMGTRGLSLKENQPKSNFDKNFEHLKALNKSNAYPEKALYSGGMYEEIYERNGA